MIAIAALFAASAVLAAAAWGTWALLSRPLSEPSDRVQLEALRTRLAAVKDAIEPIAHAFTSEPTGTPIEVTYYENRVTAASSVVESVNDVQVTSSTALEVRDLILTGGSDVVAGMQAAIEALKANDSSAADTASSKVEEGLAQLDEAQQRLDELIGVKQSADAGAAGLSPREVTARLRPVDALRGRRADAPRV